MMAPCEHDSSQIKTGESHELVLSLFNIELGIEIDPTAGVSTAADFRIADRNDRILSSAPAENITTTGHLHTLAIKDVDCTNGLRVVLNPLKSGLLETYDAKKAETTFRESLYETATLQARIFLFREDACLTGESETFDDLEKQIARSVPGTNQILVRLHKKEDKILDCIIDGVVYWRGGEQLVSTT